MGDNVEMEAGVRREPEETDRAGEGPAVGEKEIEIAMQTLLKYKEGKQAYENKIISNEQWWKMRHWDEIRTADTGHPKPASAWLFNSLANKHADAMDNFPEPNVLPRESMDKQDADTLSSILPVVLQHNQFEETYSNAWWYKLKIGTCCYGVFWNKDLENGLGDIDIRQVDLLNLFWEPGIKDIQKSANLFHCELRDRKDLESEYPETKGKLNGTQMTIAKYKYDENIDTSEKVVVVDWYYKKREYDEETGAARTILHYCKFVDGIVLFATENDPEYADQGWYAHGKYPFVLDTLFPEEGMPVGFGFIDVMKDTQLSIDGMKANIEKYGLIATNPRYFVSENLNVNLEEFADPSKQFIHVAGNSLADERMRQMEVKELSSTYLSILQMNIDELKETSGNRDFSQGATTSGVTAASAIAALQDAGSKLSRDEIKSSYRAFTQVCYLCIELIRQFYDEPREFRITGQNGQPQYVSFDNTTLRGEDMGQAFGVSLGRRVPVFDVEVVPQKASPFSKISNNELAKEMYTLGFFNPQLADQALIALQMMDFDGKNDIIQKVAQNGTLAQQVQQMQVQMVQMGQIIQELTGQNPVAGLEQEDMRQPIPAGGAQAESTALDAWGNTTREASSGQAAKARKRAAEASTPA